MHIASLRLRLLAAFIDAAVILTGIAAAIGVGIAGAIVYNRGRGDTGDPHGESENEQDDDGEYEPDDVPAGVAWVTPGRQSRQLRGAFWGASAGLAVAGRNWRSPAFRLIGLRRVDARTGGSVTDRSALNGVLFDQAWQAAWRPLFTSRAKRRRSRLRALAPQLRAVERKYRADSQARSRAVTEFYRSNPVHPARDWGWVVARPLVSQLVLAALFSRDGRTIRDRITGTSVIVDR